MSASDQAAAGGRVERVEAPIAAPPARSRRRREAAAGLLAVLAIASFNLFYRLGAPARPIWDESYYLTAIARYELGYASFASHPPLGLMLMAAGDRASGANRDVDWAPIAADKKIAGARLPARLSFFGVRCASALFGVVAAGLLFLCALEVTGDARAAFAGTVPFLFDTALVAQFRAAQLDAFQLCFAAAALLALARSERRHDPRWLAAFGASCGLATMVRANAILLLAGAALPIWRAAWRGDARARLGRIAATGGAIAAGSAIAVAGTMLAHILVAPRAMPDRWPAARADAPFVGERYRRFLQGREPLSPAVLVSAAQGYRRFMAADVAGVTRNDANGSSPWGWPLGRRPIVYRWDSNDTTTAYVMFAPNPAAWAISLLGLAGGAWIVCSARRGDRRRPLLLTLLSLWACLFASDLMLDRLRVMYLYHYALPLLCGWAMAAILLGRLPPWIARGVLVASLAGYALLAPVVLHRPLTDRVCRLRTLLSGPGLCAHRAQR